MHQYSSCEARAALFGAWTGGEDDLWPHYQSLGTCSKKIQRFIHETLSLLPDLSLSIQPALDSSSQSAVPPSIRIQCVMGRRHMSTQSQKVKSPESKVCSILLITQHTAESLLLQLLTACHSRAGPRLFGAPRLLLESVHHHYMLSIGFCYKIFLGCLLFYLNKIKNIKR